MFKKPIFSIALTFIMILSMTSVTALACRQEKPELADKGPEPYVTDLDRLARINPNFRTAIWTGNELQLTVMSIPPKGEVGLELHDDTDQFLYVVSGSATVLMGADRNKLDYQKTAKAGSGIFVPLNTWHNIVNTGSRPLKLFTVYAPPHHPHGTIHKTKEDADAAEHG